MKRLTFALLLAFASCQCTSKYKAESLSKDAAAIFSRADVPGAGGSLVVDVEQMRELGLVQPGNGRGWTAITDLSLYLLPGVATELKDQPAGRVAARAAVLIGILRDWGELPKVLRFGLLVPAPTPGAGMESMVSGVTVVAAVHGSKKENDDLLQGLAAMDRASGAPMLKGTDGDLCFEADVPGGAACMRAGDGFFALSSEQGLKTLMPGAGSPKPPASAPALLRVRLDVPLMGKADVALTGTSSVKLQANVETGDPQMSATIEKTIQDYLKRLDENRAETRAVMGPVLSQTQGALAQDPNAPPAMKKVASQMTLDRLLDPNGTYKQLRESVKVSRDANKVAFEATFPEQFVRRITEDSSFLTSAAIVGVVAAVAVPNFMKYQCRARQAEAKTSLAQIGSLMKAWDSSHETPPESLTDLGFQPGVADYTYCIKGGCLACSRPGCTKVDPNDNPCTDKLAQMGDEDDPNHFACALGNPDASGDPDDLDVWFAWPDEPPVNVQDDCE